MSVKKKLRRSRHKSDVIGSFQHPASDTIAFKSAEQKLDGLFDEIDVAPLSIAFETTFARRFDTRKTNG